MRAILWHSRGVWYWGETGGKIREERGLETVVSEGRWYLEGFDVEGVGT